MLRRSRCVLIFSLNSSCSCVSTRIFKFPKILTAGMPVTPQIKPSRIFDVDGNEKLIRKGIKNVFFIRNQKMATVFKEMRELRRR